PFPHVLGPPTLVLLGREAFQFRLTALHALLENLFEEGDAPAAAGAGAAALGELARHFRFLRANVVHQLPPRHVKAITDLGIEVHHPFVILPESTGNGKSETIDSLRIRITRRRVGARWSKGFSRGFLILTSDDLVNISTGLMVRHLNHGVRIVMRMFNQNLITRLGKAVHNVYGLSTSALAAPLIALIARTGEALGTFRLEDGTLH